MSYISSKVNTQADNIPINVPKALIPGSHLEGCNSEDIKEHIQ